MKQLKIDARLRRCLNGLDIATLQRGDEEHGQNGERPRNDKDVASVGRERA